jgi:flagellar hook protein FlgE
MGLSTVMQTALSGMNAATTIVEVSAYNIANYQTPGFKASEVHLATLAPHGSGVQVAGYEVDFSQGPIRTDDQLPLLALEGEGFFILEGNDGERLFTRDGRIHLNAAGELVTFDGARVLGFGVDAQGQIDRSQLRPIAIHLGTNLRSYSISGSGRVVGHYSDGINRTLGQLRLARFANPHGLESRAGNKFANAPAAGLPIEADPGDAGIAGVVGGATELSNVDIGSELIELTLAGNMFQANLAVFHTADNMLTALFFPWRVR